MKKRILWAVIIIVCIGLLAVSVCAADEVASGRLNENITWSLDEDGVLNINGSGEMTYKSTRMPWYKYRSQITSVVVSDNITSIADSSFRSYENLEIIILPAKLQTIADRAFYFCTNLRAVVFPDSLEYMGDMAFSDCENLTEILLPDSLSSAGSNVFQSCERLTSVSISRGLTEIPKRMFANCNNLQTIVIPDNITHIREGAFGGCSRLYNVTLPDTLTHIEDRAFVSCGFEKISIPKNVVHIGTSVFFQCDNLLDIDVKLGNCNFQFIDGALINTSTKTLISYLSANKQESYTVPDGIEIIGSQAFDSEYLKVLHIPSSVKTIEEDGHSGVLPKVKCGIYVDENNQSYSSDSGILYNKDKTILLRCPQLNNPSTNNGGYIIPNTVITINKYAFWASKITKVTFPEGLQIIGDHAFSLAKIKSVDLPPTVTEIGCGAFYGCDNLLSFEFPENLKVINSQVVDGCDKLTVISIPASVEEISEGSLHVSQCKNLEMIIVEEGNAYFSSDANGVLYTKDGTILLAYPIGNKSEIFSIPDCVTCITSLAFTGSRNLIQVIIPENIEIIQNSAFSNSTITNLTILRKDEFTIEGILPPIYGYSGAWVEQYVVEYNEANQSEPLEFYEIFETICEHQWNANDWNITLEPTCYHVGMQTRACVLSCGFSQTKIIEKTRHTYQYDVIKEATCFTLGTKRTTCSNTGCPYYEEDILPLVPHNWSDWQEISSGVQTRTCQYEGCGIAETRYCTITTLPNTSVPVEIHTGENNVDIFPDDTALSEEIRIAETDMFIIDVTDADVATDIPVTINLGTATIEAIRENETVNELCIQYPDDISVTINSGVIETINDIKSDIALSVNHFEEITVENFQSVIRDSLNDTQTSVLEKITSVNADGITNVVLGAVDINLSAGKEEIHELNGMATITIPYSLPEKYRTTNLMILFISADGTQEYMEVEYDIETETISFATDHFSLFMFIHTFSVGDIDGDNRLTDADLQYLSNYWAGYAGYSIADIPLAVLDMDSDGVVTRRDAMILSRHLAGWSGYETLPFAKP